MHVEYFVLNETYTTFAGDWHEVFYMNGQSYKQSEYVGLEVWGGGGVKGDNMASNGWWGCKISFTFHPGDND